MPVTEYTPKYKRLWLGRFGNRLVQLKPSLNPLTAVKHALATFPRAAALDPEEAAEIFISQQFPVDAGTRH